MKKNYLFKIIIFSFIFLLTGCGSSKQDKSANMEQETNTNQETENEQDLLVSGIEQIREYLDKMDGITLNLSDEDRNEMFDILEADVMNGLDDKKTIYYRLSEIISSCHHCHMSINLSDDSIWEDDALFYVDVLRDGNSYWIMSTERAYEDMLGGTIEKINGYDMETVISKYGTILSYETEEGLRGAIGNFYVSDMRYLGIMGPDDTSAVFTISKDGEIMDITMESIPFTDSIDSVSLIDVSKWPNTYRQRVETGFANYSYLEDMNNGIMYFQYLSCEEGDGQTFTEFFDEMMTKMQENDNLYTKFVVDLRWNRGGNRFLLQEAYSKYQDYLKTKQICLIIGDWTASSGVLAVEDSLTYFNNVVIYGTPTAGAVKNYTEVQMFEVPNLSMQLWLPTKIDYDPKLVEKYGDISDSVLPDVYVYCNSTDFLNGIDTIYQTIVSK